MMRVLRRAQAAAKALVARMRALAPPRVEPLDLGPCAAALERAGAQATVVHVDARREPWTATGLRAEAAAPITWLARGDSWVLSRRGIHFDAAMQIQDRGGGAPPALDGTGETHTAPAPHDGVVELCCLYPGEVTEGSQEVVYDRLMPRALFRGGFDVVVAVWPPGTDVRPALATAADSDPAGLCGREASRLADPIRPPDGWHPHPRLPLRGVHTAGGDGIDAHARVSVEIICREARAPLTDTLALRWRWRMDQLPSRLAEDTLFTHDYLSVAVEFDDGTDLTWYWSAELPAGTSYRCPLPHWRRREWHFVVRSGTDGIGTWQQEQRLIAPDRASAIGRAPPREVVRVWLIATTFAQRGEGRGSYADVALVDGAVVVPVI